MKKTILLIFIFSNNIAILFAQKIQDKQLPPWEQGEMEIHHINTGKGEAVFCIFPDSTTLLIDAGDAGARANPQIIAKLSEERPGIQIAKYITNRMSLEGRRTLDYVLLTHFHTDHMGNPTVQSPKSTKGGDYLLSGLTDVAEYFQIKKLIDRDWPTYSYPIAQKGTAFENYKKFINWQRQNNGMKMERFRPGSNSQFSLLNHPEKYPEFEIRNIISNGEVWTGDGKNVRNLFPLGVQLHENKLSAGIRISYGAFDYFNGGDLNGRIPYKSEKWRDVETPVGEVLGPVEVCEANHHGWIDAMNESFLSLVQPQIIVIQVWHATHLNLTVLQSMANKRLNPELKRIIPTNIPELSKAYLGEDQVKKLSGEGGHVVIKVKPGGNQYYINILNENDESYTIKTVYGPFKCT